MTRRSGHGYYSVPETKLDIFTDILAAEYQSRITDIEKSDIPGYLDVETEMSFFTYCRVSIDIFIERVKMFIFGATENI